MLEFGKGVACITWARFAWGAGAAGAAGAALEPLQADASAATASQLSLFITLRLPKAHEDTGRCHDGAAHPERNVSRWRAWHLVGTHAGSEIVPARREGVRTAACVRNTSQDRKILAPPVSARVHGRCAD